MKVIIFILVLVILHIILIGGGFLIWLEILNYEIIKAFLIVSVILILIDIVFGLYYLISRPSKKEGSGYHKLKIEEADKQGVEKEKKRGFN